MIHFLFFSPFSSLFSTLSFPFSSQHLLHQFFPPILLIFFPIIQCSYFLPFFCLLLLPFHSCLFLLHFISFPLPYKRSLLVSPHMPTNHPSLLFLLHRHLFNHFSIHASPPFTYLPLTSLPSHTHTPEHTSHILSTSSLQCHSLPQLLILPLSPFNKHNRLFCPLLISSINHAHNS